MKTFRTPLLRAVAVLVVLAFLAAPLLTLAYASPQAATTLTINPVADAYVNSASAGTNYGTLTSLRVDGSPVVDSFLRFSVSGLIGSSISQARLELHANSSSTKGITVKAVANNTWGEKTVKYSNMPAMGAALATSAAVPSGAWVSLNVTSYISGNGTYSFGVITPGSTAISFASRESGANAPRLIITPASPTSTTAPTSTSTPAPTSTSTPTTTSSPTVTPTISVPTDTPTDTPTNTATLEPPPTDTPAPSATPTPAALSGSIQHVFIIVMENKSYSQVWDTASTPYITQLGNTYSRATNFFAITHPSLPNYLDLFGGSNFGITTDCSPSASCHIDAPNLADNLDAKGLTWKGYMESMPSPCTLVASGNYAPKHNPLIYFDDIRTDTARCSTHVVPFTALTGDLGSAATTPNYALIVPDQCSDMHDCSISTGDTWLANHVPTILNSPACTSDKCLLVVTWDEDNNGSDNHVLAIFAGSGAATGGATSSASYTLFSLLRTVEDIFGLPAQTTNDLAAAPMNDLLH